MSCDFSRETLALYVEGDLTGDAIALTSAHLAACQECRSFRDRLLASQAMVKSLPKETVDRAECAAMRRGVMERIADGRHAGGWWLSLERGLVLGFRRQSFALTASLLLGLLSVSVLAYLRETAVATSPVVTFEGRDTLLRPGDYRRWVAVDRADRADGDVSGETRTARASGHRAYIDPASYRDYTRTRTFPEGTVMIWEASAPNADGAEGSHKNSPVLLATVKDSARFEGGWGFFDFTNPDGTMAARARAVSDSSGCRSCHRPDEDHLFALGSSLARRG